MEIQPTFDLKVTRNVKIIGFTFFLHQRTYVRFK